MAQAYPRSYANTWGKLSGQDRIGAIGGHLDGDGREILALLNNLPSQSLVDHNSKYSFSFPKGSEMTEEIDYAKMADDALRKSENESAERDGIANQYIIGHASGRHNACLIYSLLRHALGRDATNEEVDQIRY